MSNFKEDGEPNTKNTSLSKRLPQSDSESSVAATNHISESPDPIADSPVGEESQTKRKVGASRAKRRETPYDKKYRKLYDSHVVGVNFPAFEDPDKQLMLSQIGTSIWTAAEKDLFFHLLARKGRHDIKGIASEMGSKSEPEIAQYIDMLSKGLASTELSLRRQRFVDRPQYDAACELSITCTSLLERAAVTLQKAEEKEEAKEQQSDVWLLSPKLNKWVESCLQKAGESDSEISQTLPAAAFLNLGQFLHLSKRFFMNSSDLESNWRSYATRPRAPTITHSAFSDFHSLTISVTKRLVHSTLYFAMSRLRALEASDHPPNRYLRKQDVSAAVKVLGMSENHRSHWAGVARRHKLRVFENVNTAVVSGKRYNYSEIEHLLSKNSKSNSEDHTTLQDDDEDMDDLEDESSDFQSGSSSDIDPEMMDESDGSERSSSTQQDDDEPLDKEEQEDQVRDGILEKQDQRRSQAEEARLLKLLGEDPGSAMDLVEENEKLQMQAMPRKDRLELVDWTSWTDYGAEWETLKTPVPTEAFQANRRLGKGEMLDGVEAQDPYQ